MAAIRVDLGSHSLFCGLEGGSVYIVYVSRKLSALPPRPRYLSICEFPGEAYSEPIIPGDGRRQGAELGQEGNISAGYSPLLKSRRNA